MEKKTPLYEEHVKLGGKIVPFGGYMLPVQYPSGVIAEHMAVRTKAGLFDVSHMAELCISGHDAVSNIQMIFTADISTMVDGQVKYSMMCNEKGGIVDDLVIYRLKEDSYMLVVNAGNQEKDAAWIKEHLKGDVTFEDKTEDIAQIALQGPESHNILLKLCNEKDIPEKYYYFIENSVLKLDGKEVRAIVSQTGYTGEHGYEIYCPAESAEDVWNALLKAGEEFGLIPCGLGARDTLRLEAGMPLYGHEMNDEISPKEAGLPCKLNGKYFIGRQAIIERGTPARKRTGLMVNGRGIIREHCIVFSKEGKEIGYVSSGTMAPYVGKSVGMAYIDVNEIEIGKCVDVDVRGRKVEAEIVKMPFHSLMRK